MHETNHRFRQLLQGYRKQSLNKEELTEFFDLLQQPGNEALLQQSLDHDFSNPVSDITDAAQMREALGALLEKTGRRKAAVISLVWRRVAVAAAVLLLVAVGSYLLLIKEKKPVQAVVQPPVKDVLPGGDRAVLTLADGRHIVLDSVQGKGLIAEQGSVKVVNLHHGELAYSRESGAGSQESIQYNTLKTPRGGQYRLVLPDGTKVWLNAASSIHFPTSFHAKDRRVSITGEVYFEVSKDKTKPFVVDVDGRSTVEVLGTHFNINAYSNEESIRITLLEGKVKMKSQTSDLRLQTSVILSRGQQGELSSSNGLQVKNGIDIDQVMAWKNGLFNFENASLLEVMRQLARWYAVDVQYENGVPDIAFQGKLGRDVSLSKILVFFREYGVESRIENGNQLIIRKK